MGGHHSGGGEPELLPLKNYSGAGYTQGSGPFSQIILENDRAHKNSS